MILLKSLHKKAGILLTKEEFDNMIWISHRGESFDAPENTVEAFQLALDRKTSGSECDIHLTADKKLVTCHDSDTIQGR